MAARAGQPWRILIIGAGKSGKRMLRAFDHLAVSTGSYNVVGACDTDPNKQVGVPPELAFFLNAERALGETVPDVVCVCVNESAHHEILTSVAKRVPAVRLIVCEKPLTRTLEEFMDVERLLVNIPVTINFVERHSPIVRDFHNWLNRNRAQVDRMDFQWGKYRYRDNRPTMGIMSEISHPLDLVRCLAGVPASTNLSLVSANILQSNFTCMQPYVPDSINVAYTLDNIVVTGVSSFLWPTRRRQITALISNRGGARSYQAVLNFDDKHWDEDRLAIYRLDPVSGERNLEYHSEYTNDDFPEALFQTNKVARFVAESMSLLGDEPSALVAQLSDARWAQQAMHTVTQDALLLPALRFPEGKTDQQTSTK